MPSTTFAPTVNTKIGDLQADGTIYGISSWGEVDQIDMVAILGNGSTVATSTQFGIEYIPKQPVLDFSYLDSTNSAGPITAIASNAPTSGEYVWYSSGDNTGTNKVVFEPVKLDGTE